MGFRIDINHEYEFRALITGVSSKTGKPWMTLRLEDEHAEQLDISVPQEFQGDVYELRLDKGDVVQCAFRAVATSDGNSYCMLTACPELLMEGE